MDCLLHQVLVAMLAVTPAPDAPSVAKGVQASSRPAVSAPAKAKQPAAALGKKSRTSDLVVQVTVPRPAVN